MAPLQRAVALADVHDVAVLVGQDLQLDVLGIVMAAGVDDRILEVGFGFAPRRHERRGDLVDGPRDLEALAAAAARGFERERPCPDPLPANPASLTAATFPTRTWLTASCTST